MIRSRIAGAALVALLPGLAGCAAGASAPSAPAPAPAPAAGATPLPAAAARPAPPARPADVASEEAVVRALYEVISGPAGPRDWDRMRSLFTPGARIVFAVTREDGSTTFREGTVEQYIAVNAPYLAEHPFWEREIHRRADRHGSIAQVFSTYEGSEGPGTPPERGMNSIQLVRHGGRWWIANLLTDQAQPWNPLAPQYLP